MGAGDDPEKTAPLTDATGQITRARSARRRIALMVYHRGGVEVVPLRPGVAVVVGRDPSADVVIHDDSLSRRHARFTLTGEEIVVEDLGSTNGTRTRDGRVERAVLEEGEEVHLGTVAMRIHRFTTVSAPRGTDSHDALRATVELDVGRARYFNRTLAVLTVRAHSGAADTSAHVARFCHRVQEMLRPVDRVAIYCRDTIDVLLPEASVGEVEDLGRRIATLPGDAPLVCGAAVFPRAGTSADALLEAAHTAASAASPGDPVRIAGALGARPPTATGAPILRSAATRALFETAARLSRSTISVLLTGETGTGKEVLARAIHEAGPRRQKPMICINCAAIPRELVESTLFGAEPGSFTGAPSSRPIRGVFEAAHGGTILLDELGELPPAAQAALLRVLETRRVTRVGSTKEIDVDVRVIAATHRDIEAMSQTGTFREDLLYRLNAVTLTLPPLRDRRDDIAPLARHFLEQANHEHGCFLADFEPAALSLLRAYRWPGNVRELRNTVHHAVVLATGSLIRVEDLPGRTRASSGEATAVAPGPESARRGAERDEPGAAPDEPQQPLETSDDYASRMLRLEADLLAEALARTGWNQTRAAKELRMPLRTLQHKIKVLGLKKRGPAGGV